MSPFPPRLMARIEAIAAGFRTDRLTGQIVVELNYSSGDITGWNLRPVEYVKLGDAGPLRTTSGNNAR